MLRLDLGVRPPVKGPRLDLVEDLPAQLREGQELGRLDGPHQRRGPDGHGHRAAVAGERHALDDDVREQPGVGLAPRGQGRVPSELPPQVVLGLAVARQPDLAHAGHAGLADLHQEEDDLARDVARDAVDVHVPCEFFFFFLQVEIVVVEILRRKKSKRLNTQNTSTLSLSLSHLSPSPCRSA